MMKLDRYRELAPLILRLFLAFVLIYGTLDNVISHERMIEFAGFLRQAGFPSPMAAAYLSAWGQFLAGILLLVGLFTRFASLVVIINFIVAMVMVHRATPFNANIAPMAMLVGGVFFAIYGAPVYSVDAVLSRRQSPLPANAGRGLG